jgi:hypothetical protein
MADKTKAKGKKDKGAKKGKGQQQSDWPVISVSTHPHAARNIRKLKAWAGLAGFLLVGLLSYQAGVDPFEALVRALIAGIGLYLAAWMAGVTLWRSLVVEEARQEGERRRAELEERLRAAREALEGPGDDTNGDEEAA